MILHLRYPQRRGAECEPIKPIKLGSQNLANIRSRDPQRVLSQIVSFLESFIRDGKGGCKEAG